VAYGALGFFEALYGAGAMDVGARSPVFVVMELSCGAMLAVVSMLTVTCRKRRVSVVSSCSTFPYASNFVDGSCSVLCLSSGSFCAVVAFLMVRV